MVKEIRSLWILKKKYLIIANNSGGLYRFRKDLIKRLLSDGYEVYAITPFDESIDELKRLGVKLIEQTMNRRGTNPMQEIRLLLDYRRIVNCVQPDVIVTYTIKPGIYGGLIARRMKIPYAVNITGLGTAFEKAGFFREIIVRLWKTALRSAKCVFFENEENAQIFCDLSIVKKEQIHVLHGAGVNLEDFPFAEYPEDESLIHFLFIGRIMREKGMDELLEAIECLQQQYRNVRLDILGRCEEHYELRLKELEERGIIKYYGYQEDVQMYIRQAHAFVLPSYHEGMANTLLEAAAMGRPLITSNIHGCMEAVLDGETGYLCEVKNSESLMHQMERFMNLSYQQKCSMGKKSHDYVAEYFDKENIVQETIEILYEMEH